MPFIIPHVKVATRCRVQNVKSQRFLSLEGDSGNWGKDDTPATIRDWAGWEVISSPQIWTIIPFRNGQWVIWNQYSGNILSIRGRNTANGAPVIQYHSELIHAPEPFQIWDFKRLENGNYLIRNVHSDKYIGPQSRETNNNQYCIQWSDQTGEDTYQQWVFERL